MKKQKNQRVVEFGDFQTPFDLAYDIVVHLKRLGIAPTSIIEPTCGTGSFILATLKVFTDSKIIGFDINTNYLELLSKDLEKKCELDKITLQQADFFKLDWVKIIDELPKPVLIIGNPPWVTSSEIGSIGGTNIPVKKNIYGYQGLDSKTGKSNFDISEWMILELLKSLNGHFGTLAMLCKVNTARKVLLYAKRKNITILSSKINLIDAKKHFNASVGACLFTCNLKPNFYNYNCQIYQNIFSNNIIQEIGYINDKVIANISLYNKWKHLQGDCTYVWRSGIKHDCAKVMELKRKDNKFINGFGEVVTIEDEYIYPMLKSSDLAKNRIKKTNRWMIVTQKSIGEDTSTISITAPLLWNYLEKYSKLLDKRASSIYRNRPRYSIFGVGAYSFFPWKIAISGFYKKLDFKLIGPFLNKPVVFDDTCYFIPSETNEETQVLYSLLNHQITKEFYSSFIFWDAKRPITKQILQLLDFEKLSCEISKTKESLTIPGSKALFRK